MSRAFTHLMFQGNARAALETYEAVFPDFTIDMLELNGDDTAAPGTVRMAKASFAGQSLIVIDSPIPHDFDFTPSMSLFVEMGGAETLDAAFARLSEGGKVLMPPDNYGFSPRFGWLTDRFGLSWQLSLPM
ncbi:VOC family protein [Stappia indica]|uniref:VOC family protein n=1 Tax=Stappia indica TaxID=538381 RepID=A0A857CE06_9HYPH|nr:VOC family protein [Stappia indica]QGZ37077.1 VOC family protein [Stappia indica]